LAISETESCSFILLWGWIYSCSYCSMSSNLVGAASCRAQRREGQRNHTEDRQSIRHCTKQEPGVPRPQQAITTSESASRRTGCDLSPLGQQSSWRTCWQRPWERNASAGCALRSGSLM
jgi:hypothetical protein